ncbi:MAG: C45 family autoproteolytic acyltransferase/hydrolase [Anaerolineae bacterium]
MIKRGFLLAFVLFSFWRSYPTPEQPAVFDSSKVYGLGVLERQEVLVLHLRGTLYEMGYQQGVLLRQEIRGRVASLYGELTLDPLPLLLQEARLLEIPDEFREEMLGLAQGAGVSYTDILLLNSWPQLVARPRSDEALNEILTTFEPWFPPHIEVRSPFLTPNEPGASWVSLSPGATFALFGEASKSGNLLHGVEGDMALERILLILYEPEVGNAFVSLSGPGMVGVNMGLNEERISVAYLDVPSLDSSLRGVPLPFTLRRVLQYSGDLPQALRIIASAPRTGGANVVIGDGKPASAAVLELSAHRHALFEAQDGYVVRTSRFSDSSLLAFQGERDSRASEERYSLWEEMIRRRYGLFDLEKVLFLLSHQCETGGDRCYPKKAGDEEMMLGAVMAASDLELWVVSLDPGGAIRKWGFNLREELER